MNTEQVVSVGAAVVLVLVVALSAATLQSSVSTDPADAVDLDAEYLPLDDGEIAEIDRELRESSNESGGIESGDGTTNADATAETGDASKSSAAGGSSDGDASAEVGSSDGNDASGGDARDRQMGSGYGPYLPETPSWWPLVALFVLVGLAGVGYRYADRLAAALGMLDGDGSGKPGHDGKRVVTPAPENEVQRAWIELIEQSDIDDPWTKTPRECARTAIERGHDPEAVRRLCRTFESVTYGGAVATDERVRAADEALDRSRREAA